MVFHWNVHPKKKHDHPDHSLIYLLHKSEPPRFSKVVGDCHESISCKNQHVRVCFVCFCNSSQKICHKQCLFIAIIQFPGLQFQGQICITFTAAFTLYARRNEESKNSSRDPCHITVLISLWVHCLLHVLQSLLAGGLPYLIKLRWVTCLRQLREPMSHGVESEVWVNSKSTLVFLLYQAVAR